MPQGLSEKEQAHQRSRLVEALIDDLLRALGVANAAEGLIVEAFADAVFHGGFRQSSLDLADLLFAGRLAYAAFLELQLGDTCDDLLTFRFGCRSAAAS